MFLIGLSVYKDDFPWVYDMGKELIDVLRSKTRIGIKRQAIMDFRKILDFTCEHPLLRDAYSRRKDRLMMLKDMQFLLTSMLKEFEVELME